MELLDNQKKEIKQLVHKYITCFAKDKFDVAKIQNGEAQVKLSVDKYISLRPYRCSIPDKKEIETQIQQLLKANLIETSCSPFAAPVTLVHKKEDGRRTRFSTTK